ncbi:MAG: CRISPR-associated helicase Cas3' [Nitrososphaerota archaeon]
MSSCRRFYSHPGIELKKHLLEVGKLCKEYIASASVADPKLIEAAELIGKCHDIGKYTHFFQRHLLGERVQGDLSTHSKLSATFASWLINKRLGDPLLAAVGFICVFSHHGDLKNFSLLKHVSPEWLGEPIIMKQVESIRNNIGKISGELDEVGLQEFPNFISNFRNSLQEINQTLNSAVSSLLKLGECERWRSYYNTLLMFSALVDADKKDAGKVKVTSQSPLPSDLISKYIEKKFASAEASEINMLRRTIFSEVNKRLDEALTDGNIPRIATITLPTGAGKTLLGVHVALKISERLGYKRIIYCLPYINIIEQTHAVIEDALSAYYGKKPDISMLLKHHHLFFPVQGAPPNEASLDKLLLLTDSWESNFIITTFEQLMRSIIGCRNSLLKKFHNLAGSILILDEVQAIPLEYWRLVRDALLYLAENFNMRIILMTATMPAIFGGVSVEILPDSEKYFKSMNRVELIPQLEKSVDAEQFVDFFLSKWTKGESALLVVNTIRTSKKVYEKLVEKLGSEAVSIGRIPDNESMDPTKVVLTYLSTSVIPKERKRRVELLKKLLKERRNIIVVSTQVIEAGVDLDFDIVFRDLGPLDSIVQVAGRCNRNWKIPKGRTYVLKMINEKGQEDSTKIYGKILPKMTAELIAHKEKIEEHELAELMKPYYKDVSYRMNVESNPNCNELLKKIKRLDFQELAHFSLIEEDHKVPVYIEYDDNAKRLLKEFKETVNILEREEHLEKVFEVKAMLRKLRTEMENYIVEVYKSERLKSLKRIMDQADVLLVPHEEIEAYYDSETGFKTMEEPKFLIF